MGTLTIILTDGPYISEYAEMAYKIARVAIKKHGVNIFLYLDAVHIPKAGQDPSSFSNAGMLFEDLMNLGVRVEACVRCSTARGYAPKNGRSDDYIEGVIVTSLYSLAGMIEESDKVMVLGR